MEIIFMILGGVFAALFMVFLLPILGYVLNIGNIAGMIFCAFMMALLFGHKAVQKIAHSLWQNVFGRLAVIAAAALFAAGIVYVSFLTALIINADSTPPEEDSVVIVLGCQVRGDTPSLMLMQRINAAADYLNENPSAVCIVSGGKGDDEQISEAECMYSVLTKMGIGGDRIFIEDRSTNTAENIAFSKEIIEKNGLSHNTAIVTDVFHEYRASRIVRSAGLGFGSVPAQCSWYLVPTFYVREMIAITAVFAGLA